MCEELLKMELKDKIDNLLNNSNFYSFDLFIIKWLGFDTNFCDKENEEETRRAAYKEFRQRINKHNIASVPTMYKWFGLNGKRKPSRENVYEMCIRLGCSREDTEAFLTEGLCEPSFQAFDYHELIFLYAIDSGLSYEAAEKLIKAFEKNLSKDIEFNKTMSTNQILKFYETKKDLSFEEFLLWITDRSSWFKGYSSTLSSYMNTLKKQVFKYIKSDAHNYLDILLSESGFLTWKRKHKITNKSDGEHIRKFIKSSDSKISDNDKHLILELSKIVYSKTNANVRLISELSICDGKNKFLKTTSIPILNNKYLSDLFTIPLQRERNIRAIQALRTLEDMNENESCPEYIKDLCSDLFREKKIISTVKEATDTLTIFCKEHKRRTLMIQRSDILPIVLYLYQIEYDLEENETYNCEQCKKGFIDYANSILNACRMTCINERYELDSILLACFCDDKMYDYSDVLEALSGN